MKDVKKTAVRLAAGVAALILPVLAAPTHLPAIQPIAPAGETPSANIKGETRLRKLHLVRPDLIPYPIAYEVYC